MLEQDVSYSMKSEIDKAFPYLDQLDEEIYQLKTTIEKKKLLQKSPKNEQKRKFSFLNIFLVKKQEKKEIIKENDISVKLRKKTLKHHNYFKDGYLFQIHLIQRYDEISTRYYEFSVDITFDELVKKEQFYKKIYNLEEAKQYYLDMEGVFKCLKRRDLMERLFKEKIKEIESYKASL